MVYVQDMDGKPMMLIEVFGFRLFDKVLYNNEIFFIYGRRKSGSFNIRDFNGENPKDVSHKKFKLIRGKMHPIILKQMNGFNKFNRKTSHERK